MLNALKVVGIVAFALGMVLTLLTLVFAFTWGIRIVGFLLAIFGVGYFMVYVVYSWWVEYVIEPIRKKSSLKKRK